MDLQQHPARLSPDGLIDWISALCPSTAVAIDCGAGLCDVSAMLTARFDAVQAVDISLRTLKAGFAASNLFKVTADAADLPVRSGCSDLVISMQSLHFFDLPCHTAQARRVLKPGGIFAALCYGDLELKPPLRRTFANLRATIGPFWETEKRLTDCGYRTLDFGDGFTEVAQPPAGLKRKMSVREISTYFARSSAARAATAMATGRPLRYPSGTSSGWAIWPIHGRVFRKL